MAELIGENKVTLNTAAYFNPNGQTRAGIEMPDYAAKYMDENDIIHPAVIYLTMSMVTTRTTTLMRTSPRQARAAAVSTSSSQVRNWLRVHVSR